MPPSVANPASAAQVPLPDVARRMAKAQIRKADQRDLRVAVGAAIRRATQEYSLKELSGLVDRDERTLSRWMSGAERPQLDALFAVAVLKQPLVVALAALAGDQVEIETVVRVTARSAR